MFTSLAHTELQTRRTTKADSKHQEKKTTVFWDVRSLIILMMEALSTFEKSVNFYETIRRNIPEDSHVGTRCHQNLIPHQEKVTLKYN